MAGRSKSKARTNAKINEVRGRERGKAAYTDEERATRMLRIRDNCLDWWDDLAAARTASGIGSAQDAYHKAVVELAAIQTGTEGANGITIHIEGADLSLIEDGGK